VLPNPAPRDRGELTSQLAVACIGAGGAIAAVMVGQVL
jgi:hypothetical protein